MVVEAKDSYDVMLLPGDGIGPEITAATVNALEPLQSLFKLNFKEVGGWLLTITITRLPALPLHACCSLSPCVSLPNAFVKSPDTHAALFW